MNYRPTEFADITVMMMNHLKSKGLCITSIGFNNIKIEKTSILTERYIHTLLKELEDTVRSKYPVFFHLQTKDVVHRIELQNHAEEEKLTVIEILEN